VIIMRWAILEVRVSRNRARGVRNRSMGVSNNFSRLCNFKMSLIRKPPMINDNCIKIYNLYL